MTRANQISTEIGSELRTRFDVACAQRGKKVKDAIAEAITRWVDESPQRIPYLNDLNNSKNVIEHSNVPGPGIAPSVLAEIQADVKYIRQAIESSALSPPESRATEARKRAQRIARRAGLHSEPNQGSGSRDHEDKKKGVA